MDEIILEVQPAGIGPVAKMIARRGGARLIDLIVLGVIGWLALMSLPIERMGDHGWIIGLVIVILYDSFSHSKFGGGATVGKWVFGLRVVDSSGRGLTWRRAIVRSLPMAFPLVAQAMGLELRSGMSTALGTAGYYSAMGMLVGWTLGAPLLMAVTAPSRSYCDLFGRSICLSRRMVVILGLPRQGVHLFAKTVSDEKARSNPNLFTARMALVHLLWAVPLLVFAIAGTFCKPVLNNGKDVQTQLRNLAEEKKLPIRGIVVQRADDESDSVLVQARVAGSVNGMQYGQRDIEAVSLAFWGAALNQLPSTIPPEHVIVELRTGPDLGFSSKIVTYAKSYKLQLTPPIAASDSSAADSSGRQINVN